MSWRELWQKLTPEERHAAVSTFYDTADSPESQRALIHLFARGLNMREQTLSQWPRDRLIGEISRRAELAVRDELWPVLLHQYFRAHRNDTIAAILRHLNVDPPEDRLVPALDTPLLPEAARACVRALSDEVPVRDMRLAAAFLSLSHEAWQPLADALSALPPPPPELPPIGRDPMQVLVGFTTVDRIVIEHVVGTSSQAEGALDEAQLDDLVQTLIALNPRRKRSYLLLGYADVLVAGRSLDFKRQEFDDERRSWYLAGALLGLARRPRNEALVTLLNEQAEVFRRAAGDRGAGLVLAKSLLPELVPLGRIGEAVHLVAEQIEEGGLSVARPALEQAVNLLRASAVADAMAILRPLWDAFGEVAPDSTAAWTRFRRALTRRVAQCSQALADFERAETLLARISDEGSDEERARALADRGLVAASMPSVFGLTLPDTRAEREVRVAALTAGETLFTEALQHWPGQVVTSLVALGQLAFLRWRLDGERDAAQRDAAVGWLQGAVTQMRLSDTAPVYERSGLLGQALFMLTLLLLHRMGPTDINAAMEAWRQIDAAAGRFPEEDLQLLLEVADMVSDAHATQFEESIWAHRKSEALALVLSPVRVKRSERLRRDLTAMAQDPTTSLAVQRRLWMTLVPALLELSDLRAAERGLDALEGGAETDDGLHEVVQFLSQPRNYEPAWTEVESLWARTRLMRRLGQDAAVADYLRMLFYRVRDVDVDMAAQIADLVDTWRLGEDLCQQLSAALPAVPPAEAGGDEQARLLRGEAVSIVFVGGNETQEQYDDRLRRNLTALYPGMRISFRHTGWTSNWGQQLPGLIADCNGADAVVLMTMMRTMLGRGLREALQRPWVSCAARGEKGIERSILKAAEVALRKRNAPH